MMLLAFIVLSLFLFMLDFKDLKKRGKKYIVAYAVVTVLSCILFFFAEYTDFHFAGLVF